MRSVAVAVVVFLAGGVATAPAHHPLTPSDDSWHGVADVKPLRKEMASVRMSFMSVSTRSKVMMAMNWPLWSSLGLFMIFSAFVSIVALVYFFRRWQAEQKGFVCDWYFFDSATARTELSAAVPGTVWLTDKRLFALTLHFHSKQKPVSQRTKDVSDRLDSTIHEQPDSDREAADGQCDSGRFGVIPTYLAQGGGCMTLPEIKNDAKSSFPWFVKAADIGMCKDNHCYMTFEECVSRTWCTGTIPEERHQAYVIQPHIPRPMLIDGYKFDLRLHVVMVAQKGPAEKTENSTKYLKAFLFEEVLCKLANAPWSQADTKSKAQHTNATLLSAWDMAFHQRLLRNIPHGEEILRSSTEAIEHCLSCASPYLHQGALISAREILGFDIIIDEDRRAWVIEVNNLPGNTPGKYTQETYEQVHLRIKRDLPVLASQPLLEGRPAEAIEGWQELHF